MQNHALSALKAAAIALVAVLAGCTTTVKEYYPLVIAPSAAMLEQCALIAPPLPEQFAKLPEMEQEASLTGLLRQQYQQTYLCNARLSAIGQWRDKQLELVRQKYGQDAVVLDEHNTP